VKSGESSKSAAFVCLARAAAHGETRAPRFSDPTAFALLSDDARASLLRLRAGVTEASDALAHVLVRMRSEAIVTRTLAIDDAVRDAAALQVVNLGAGFDGRAWRMRELSEAVVFEVDHPDAQAEKRARVAPLTTTAKEVRFVPVDLARDPLDVALAGAGHDAETATLWIWEGVIPYLTPSEVEATLQAVRRCSAHGSRIAIAYQAPSTREAGAPSAAAAAQQLWQSEPLRSWWTADEMRDLLARAGFQVTSDRDLVDLAATLGADLSGAGPGVGDGRAVVAVRG
jgi:methyltransferase (TIGR00027 family)